MKEVKKEEPAEPESEKTEEESKDAPAVKRKGPKPKGMKKFKQVQREEDPIPEEEMSAN